MGETSSGGVRGHPQGPQPTSTPTVNAYLTRWLDEVIRPHDRPATYALYEMLVRCYIRPHLGKKRLDRLAVRDVQTRWRSPRMAPGWPPPATMGRCGPGPRTAPPQAVTAIRVDGEVSDCAWFSAGTKLCIAGQQGLYRFSLQAPPG